MPVVELLSALSTPFLKSRSNDDVRYEDDVLGLVTTGCELAVSAPPRVAAAALEMVLALAVPPPSGATDAATLAREAMALGPRIESLRVQRDHRAGAVPTIVAAVARSVREDAAGLSLGNTMGSSSRGGPLGPSPVWERPTRRP